MKGSILFLGSGLRCGTPCLEHVFKNIHNLNHGISQPYCKICSETINTPSKDKRNPFSLIIKNPINNTEQDNGDDQDCFLFEMGQNFRISMFEYAVPMNIKKIDSIFFLSSNESSFLGIDETREVQIFEKKFDDQGTLLYCPKKRIPIYLTSSSLISLNNWYNYIINYSLKEDLNSKTKVGCIQLNVLDPEKSTDVIRINSIEEYDSYLSRLLKNREKNDKNDLSEINLDPIKIDYSTNIKIVVLFFIDSENLICSGYMVEYFNHSEKKVVCILPEYSVIPRSTLLYLKNTDTIDFLILPLFSVNVREINQDVLSKVIDFCKQINCNQFYFYNINCLYGHDDLQLMIDNYCKNNDIDLKFTISYDSLNIQIY